MPPNCAMPHEIMGSIAFKLPKGANGLYTKGGSMVKSIGCTSGGNGFDLNHLHGGFQLCNFSSRGYDVLFSPQYTPGMYLILGHICM